ncbi:MAG: DinB family protein [Candidatus Thorarchaeota archaeon]
MNEEWFRKMLIAAHNNQREHLNWILSGLTEEHLIKQVTDEERLGTILGILWHIGSAENFWFHKSGHSIGPRFDASDVEVVLKKLSENSERIAEVVNTCSMEQLRIVPPSPESGPSVAWALIRTHMHGIYHTGQISKIRRMMGASKLPEKRDDIWSTAIDSVSDLIHGLLHDAIEF